MHPALAGAAAAAVWGMLEPLGRRVFRSDYSDVAVLARLTGGRRRGFALHVANGAVFGLVAGRVRANPVALALAEHVALWPSLWLVDRKHAASPRAFALSGAGHLLFGALLAAATDGGRRGAAPRRNRPRAGAA